MRTLKISFLVFVFSVSMLAQFELDCIPTKKVKADSNFTLLGRWIDGPCYTSFIVDNLAFVGKGVKLDVLDITDPGSSNLLSSLTIDGIIKNIFVKENLVFIAAAGEGMKIIDATNPILPIEIGSYIIMNYDALDVYVQGNYAFVAFGYAGLRILDISDPTNPVEVGIYNLGLSFDGVFVQDNFTYIADTYNGMRIVDVTNPSNPIPTGSFIWHYGFGRYFDVYAQGNLAYLVREEWGLRIIDVSDKSNPVEIGYYDTPGIANSVFVQNNFTFIADGESGLRILDVTNPQSPYETGYFDSDGNSIGIFVQTNHAYLSDENNGLRIIDVNNVSNPVELGYYDAGGLVYDTFTKDDLVYVVGQGLKIIDISHIPSIEEIGYFDCGEAGTVFVEEGYAYVGESFYGLRIIDVSDPLSLSQVGVYPIGSPSIIRDIIVIGNVAYVCTWGKGLMMLDIGDKSNPSLLSSMSYEVNPAMDISIQGIYCYLGYDGEGFKVLNISNPYNPFVIATGWFWGSPEKVDANGEFAYVSYSDNEILIVDISSPSNPAEVGSFITSDYVYNIRFQDYKLFVAAGNSGVYILKNDLITNINMNSISNFDFSLSPNYPNPFNPSTIIKYTIPNVETRHASSLQLTTLKVYDILGKEVAILVNEEKPAGTYEVEFNSASHSGEVRNLPSGIYFYQLKVYPANGGAGEYLETKKMILLR